MRLEISPELVEQCMSDDRDAQRHLYDQLWPYLNAICKRYLRNSSDLKDVLQNTFIRIFRSLRQFDIQKASFKTWATKIAINACIKKNTINGKQATQELIIELHEPLVTPDIIKKLSNEEIRKWLKKMPPNYFDVFNLFIIDGFSHAEIAEILDIDISLSRKRLSRSRDWLKKKLSNDFTSFSRFSFHSFIL